MICFSLLTKDGFSQNPLEPIGFWREHLPYQHCIQIVNGDKIYAATDNAIFSVKGNEINRFSKITGLNDIGISAIAWDSSTAQLVIAYTNSNVDVLKSAIIKNIGDIKRSNISANKSIYQIFCDKGIAYLSAGLGIILTDLNKYEIKDTWYLGNNGNQIKVYSFNKDYNYFYAATEEGLKRVNPNLNDPANPNSWENISGQAGLSNGPINSIININGKIVVRKNDSLLIQQNNIWNLIYYDPNWPILNINSSASEIDICQRKNDGTARVLTISENGTILDSISKAGSISLPKDAMKIENHIWVADLYNGLIDCNTNYEQYIPNGPLGISSGDMVFNNDQLNVAAGAVNDAWNYQYDRDGIFNYSNDTWSYQGYYNRPQLDSVFDFISLAIDPDNSSIWAGSFGGGLVNFLDKKINIYKQNNSLLQATIGDPGSYRVSGLAFDQNKNLWISNYGAPKNLKVKKLDGSWTGISVPYNLTENALGQIIIDDANQLYIVSPKGNGLICYNPGNNIDAITDDKWKLFQAGIGLGNLPSNNVLCIAKDKNGYIWVGTDKGIAVIQCGTDLFASSGCDAILPIIQQDQFAGYLFQNEIVQCIAVDGANRKWVGTKNGIFLVSPEGDKIIYQFNTDNSPLLNNDIKKIAIHPNTGEVFIATYVGICSFRSTATEASENLKSVLVFPNPVPPGFNGSIAIRGLTDHALVKIAELNGTLVYETRALGGQAIWDGKNYKGQKVASGIYLVIIRDDSGNEKMVSKIIIISGR